MARMVAVSMPPITEVPMAMRLLAPAPVEIASGVTPAMNASDVITIGRSRSRAPVTAASTRLAPRWYAASEVCVGLGLVVALNRRHLSLDVDTLSELRG